MLVGRVQASSVSGPVRRSAGVSAMVTSPSTPLNASAAPLWPFVVQVTPPWRTPALPLLELSRVVVPLPSSKPYAATRPVAGGGGSTAAATSFEGGPTLPVVSSAVTL